MITPQGVGCAARQFGVPVIEDDAYGVLPPTGMGRSSVILMQPLWIIASPWVYGYTGNVGGLGDSVALGIVMSARATWSWALRTLRRVTSPVPAH